MNGRVPIRRLALVALSAALALTACGGDDDDSAAELAYEGTADEPAEEPAQAPAAEDDAGFGGDDAGFDLGIVGRDVIIEMDVVVSSDDIPRAVASITSAANRLGGGVASSEIDYGDPASGVDQGFAVLTVKVPPESVERLLSGLDDVGEVRSINQSAQDVTEQLVDLDIRIQNARESVANVREFMERAENLKDLVTLEGELTRRQTELERLEAQQRNLSERVAFSTITIQVVTPTAVPPPVDEDDDSIGDAFRQGWDAFVAFVFAVGYTLAVLLPFLVLVAFAYSAARWTLRAVRRARNTGNGEKDEQSGTGADTTATDSAGEDLPAPPTTD